MQRRKPSTRSRKPSAKKRPGGQRKFFGIRPWQLKLPAGYTSDGKKMATLEEVLTPHIATRDFAQLSPGQQAALTVERIRRQRTYKVGMVGAGVIDKKRAIAEVEGQTDIGRTLMEIERRTIRMLEKKAKS